jgi:3'(2'), 5'-bisphosphate nucleotidase
MPAQCDHEFARNAATQAGDLLLQIQNDAKKSELSPTQLGKRGDNQSHELLVGLITNTYPDDAILSEEGIDNPTRHLRDRVWIIDPLDGTREYSAGDRTDWAVHVALVEDHTPTAGAVALPSLGETFDSRKPIDPLTKNQQIKVICSRTRPSPAAELIAERLGGELLYMGSAGAKAMAVVRGDADIYAHTGGQYEWDSCAPVAVATASGLHASRLDGSPLRYNLIDTYLPDLLICRKELAEPVLTLLN